MRKIRKLQIRDHRTLLVFQKTMEWFEQIRKTAGSFPNEEWKVITLKMLKASSKVSALIAYGNSQFYLTIESESYRKALIKAKETQGLLEGAFVAGYIGKQEFERMNEKINEICMMLTAMKKKITKEIEGERIVS